MRRESLNDANAGRETDAGGIGRETDLNREGSQDHEVRMFFGCGVRYDSRPTGGVLLGHSSNASTSAATRHHGMDPRRSLLDILAERQQKRAAVTKGSCEDEIEDIDVVSAATKEVPLKIITRAGTISDEAHTDGGIRKRPLRVEDAMDAWLGSGADSTVVSSVIDREPGELRSRTNHRVATTIREMATHRDISNILSSSRSRVVAQSTAPSNAVTRLDDLIAASDHDSIEPHSRQSKRVDTILEEDCPFDEETLIAGIDPHMAGGRRSGGGGRHSATAFRNPTAFAVTSRLNKAYEDWRHLADSGDKVSFCGAVRKLDCSSGIVALLCSVVSMSDSLIHQVRTKRRATTPAAEKDTIHEGTVKHVIVVVEEEVYRGLHVLVGGKIELAPPITVFPPTVASSGLFVLLASFCIRVARERTGGGYLYDPLADADGSTKLGLHHHGGGTGEEPRGVDRITTSGIAEGPDAGWYVPAGLLESLYQHHQQTMAPPHGLSLDCDTAADDDYLESAEQDDAPRSSSVLRPAAAAASSQTLFHCEDSNLSDIDES